MTRCEAVGIANDMSHAESDMRPDVLEISVPNKSLSELLR